MKKLDRIKADRHDTAATTADLVADYFIGRFHEAGDNITNLQLQKLVYYAQAWFLALFGKRLIDCVFEAWVHGPVIPSLYARFRDKGWEPIMDDVELPKFSKMIEDHLDEIIDVFGKFTARQLENMTHQESPWIEARGTLDPMAPSHNVISEDTMLTFYRNASKN